MHYWPPSMIALHKDPSTGQPYAPQGADAQGNSTLLATGDISLVDCPTCVALVAGFTPAQHTHVIHPFEGTPGLQRLAQPSPYLCAYQPAPGAEQPGMEVRQSPMITCPNCRAALRLAVIAAPAGA